MKSTLVIGGSGFIGSYLMKELALTADNFDITNGNDIREGIPTGYKRIILLACDQANTREAYEYNTAIYEQLNQCLDWPEQPDLIYVSSAAVYDVTSWYALSKMLGEAYAKRFRKYTILRPSNIYGHGDGHGAPDRFMRGENQISGIGNQVRDIIPVEAVVTAILNADTDYKETINVSSGIGTTVNTMFKIFGKGDPLYIEDGDVGVYHSVLTPGVVDED